MVQADRITHTATRRRSGIAERAVRRRHQGRADKRVGASDPVCGMAVDPARPRITLGHGRTDFFCGAGCRTGSTPTRSVLRAREPRPTPAPAGAIYTCPMHPEVRQDGPGACPICGMALEPAGLAATSAQPRTGRHDPALLDRAGVRRCRCSCSPWAAHSADARCAGAGELGAAALGDAGGALGRLAVPGARLGLASSAATSTCSP